MVPCIHFVFVLVFFQVLELDHQEKWNIHDLA